MILMSQTQRVFRWALILGLSIWAAGWAAQSSPVGITVDNPSKDHVDLTIDFPEPSHQLIQTDQGSQDRWWYPEEQSFSVPGQPELPIISRWVQVSETGGVQAEVIYTDEDEYPASQSGPVTVPVEQDISTNSLALTNDSVFPDWTVRVSDPVIAGGVRLVSLEVAPVRYDPQRNVYRVARRVRVSVVNTGGEGINPVRHSHPIAPEFADIFRESVINWVDDANPIYYGDLRARYLIIALDTFLSPVSDLEDLVAWKEQKGYDVMLIGKDTVGSTAIAIKQYIQSIYNSEGPPLTYVLLVGDEHVGNPIPSFYIESPTHAGEWDVSDHPYSMMEGDDFFPDLFVGRLSTSSLNEVKVMVNKILLYEKTPFTANTEWFRNATVVAGNYTDTGRIPLTPVQTSMWIQDHFLDNGFTRVDTLFYWGPGYPSISPAAISASINQGVSWVTYRGFADIGGWQYPLYRISDVGNLSNGQRLPVVTSFVCRTGDFANDTNPGFGEKWLVTGTIGTPKCGVAFIGASDLNTNTRFNNPLAAGFFVGVFDDRLEHIGQAMLRGKMELYNGFPTEQGFGEYCEFYFYVYNLLGDPELSMRSRIPTTLSADHPSTMQVGDSYIEVTTRSSGGNIVPNAQVTLYKADETHVTGKSGSDGTVMLPVNLVTPGTMNLTVHTPNCVAYTSNITVSSPSAYAGLSSVTYSAGGDEIVSPGEQANVTVTLRNTGSTNLSNVSATLSTDDPMIEVGTSTSGFGSIDAGATATNTTPYTFTVTDYASHNYQAMMTLTVTATGQGPWTHHFWVPIWGPFFSIEGVQISGNGILDPGETADVTITLRNDGVIASGSFQADMSSWNNGLTFPVSTATFPNIGVNQSGSNSSPFQVTVPADMTPGRLAEIQLTVTASGEVTQVMRTSLTIGHVDTTYPLGPDAYGYWAYDNGDQAYSEAPDYNWIELDPAQGGTGATGHMLHDDESIVVSLPFSFRFYGHDFNEITLCSNGWISFGETWMSNFRNWHMPSALGPQYLVAGFWDDIRGHPVHPDTLNPLPREIWTRNDGDQFVIEWNDWYNLYGYENHDFNIATFEIILVPVSGDDGEIIMQYGDIENVDADNNYGTVGIENGPHSIGLEYTFANLYPPSCPPLRSGLAIKFTTDAPDPYLAANEPSAPLPDRVALLPGYPNPFNSQAILPLELSKRERVKISVFDVMGRKVGDLRDEVMDPGRYRVTWDAQGLPSGIYFVTMHAGAVSQIQKIVLLK
jgi:hypothetical protein